MDEALSKEINSLINNRIWVTKKTRIEAESRLKLNNVLSDILIIYYTFSLIAFSIWALVLNPESGKAEHITVVTLILSVGLFGITLFLSSIGFKQKANQFKESYHKLDSLETDVRQLLRTAEFKTKEIIIDEFYVLEKKYIDILTLTDNHNNVDFEKLVIVRKLKELTHKMQYKHYSKNVLKWFFIIVLFTFPILLTFLV